MSEKQYAVYSGMKLLGTLIIDLPDAHLGTVRPFTFSISFGGIEIRARAYNNTNGQNYVTIFELNEKFSDTLVDIEQRGVYHHHSSEYVLHHQVQFDI
ncbi:9431_t:CDS:2 [Funneliformis geosporum]|nr:9431_t:CDS:2 [Funneliformis geosporum]